MNPLQRWATSLRGPLANQAGVRLGLLRWLRGAPSAALASAPTATEINTAPGGLGRTQVDLNSPPLTPSKRKKAAATAESLAVLTAVLNRAGARARCLHLVIVETTLRQGPGLGFEHLRRELLERACEQLWTLEHPLPGTRIGVLYAQLERAAAHAPVIPNLGHANQRSLLTPPELDSAPTPLGPAESGSNLADTWAFLSLGDAKNWSGARADLPRPDFADTQFEWETKPLRARA